MLIFFKFRQVNLYKTDKAFLFFNKKEYCKLK